MKCATFTIQVIPALSYLNMKSNPCHSCEIVFCKQGSKIIEIRPNSAGDVIKNLAEANKHIYYDISVMPKTINFNNQAGDIEVNLEELKNKLKL